MSVVDRRATIAHLKDRQGGRCGYQRFAWQSWRTWLSATRCRRWHRSINSSTQEYFEVQALCERDGGRLWGVSMCRPMVIGDMRTQTMATSRPAPEGARPQVVGLVNAPIEWGGATWGAYVWDFMVNGTPRFPQGADAPRSCSMPRSRSSDSECQRWRASISTRWTDGIGCGSRWRARSHGRCGRPGEPRALAVGDALAFRQARRMLYPGSVESERAAEITEGGPLHRCCVLAANTTADAIASALDQLVEAETQDSFVRTFAYVRARLWPPARCLIPRLDPSRAEHRRSRVARDACARGPTSR